MADSNNLLTVAEICNLLKLSKSSVYKMISDGTLRRFELPGVHKVLVKKEDIERLLNG
jgi:excisionase family DNA binding protein